jgi:hypothetical protein
MSKYRFQWFMGVAQHRCLCPRVVVTFDDLNLSRFPSRSSLRFENSTFDIIYKKNGIERRIHHRTKHLKIRNKRKKAADLSLPR